MEKVPEVYSVKEKQAREPDNLGGGEGGGMGTGRLKKRDQCAGSMSNKNNRLLR